MKLRSCWVSVSVPLRLSVMQWRKRDARSSPAEMPGPVQTNESLALFVHTLSELRKILMPAVGPPWMLKSPGASLALKPGLV